jgi:hypothetical protein
VERPKLEIVVAVVALATLLFGIVGGVSPHDRFFWYSIPAAMIAVGLLLAKRAEIYARRRKRLIALLLGLAAAFLLIIGSQAAIEFYVTTPPDMGGHPL